MYTLVLPTASATNPYAEIYFDQQNSNAALQLVAVSAMLVHSG
jgi:hypothetical protein